MFCVKLIFTLVMKTELCSEIFSGRNRCIEKFQTGGKW